jgi:hypothetical protein
LSRLAPVNTSGRGGGHGGGRESCQGGSGRGGKSKTDQIDSSKMALEAKNYLPRMWNSFSPDQRATVNRLREEKKKRKVAEVSMSEDSSTGSSDNQNAGDQFALSSKRQRK